MGEKVVLRTADSSQKRYSSLETFFTVSASSNLSRTASSLSSIEMKTSSSSQLNETDLAYLEVLTRQLANEEITLKGFNIKKEAILARYHQHQKQEGKIWIISVKDSSIQ